MFDPQSLRLEGHKRKRLKVNGACDACRDRKTRCDGRHPVCLACETRNCAQYCRYTRRAKGNDLTAASTTSRPVSVQSTISAPPSASGKISQRIASSTWDSPAKESDGLATLTSYDDNSTYGSSSTVAFFRRILSADDVIRSAVRLERDENSLHRQKSLAKPHASVAVLPERRDTDDFISCYWNFVHPMFPVLHKPTFCDQYRHAGEMEIGNENLSCFSSGREHAVFLSMLNLVCALGCQFSNLIRDVQKTSVAYEFYERSKQAFQHDWLDAADLSIVQLLLLNGVYLQSTRHANRCWNSVGLAIRASQILGLHVEDQRHAMSQLEHQMRRRIWHTCVSLDRLLSMTFGRPTMIHGTNSVPLPLIIDDDYLRVEGVGVQPHDAPSYLSLFVNSCVLLEILRDVLHFVTTCEPGSEQAGEEANLAPIPSMVAQVLELNRRLDRFSTTLPIYLHMGDSGMEKLPCSNEVGFQKKVLYCRFLLTRLLLLRPMLLSMVANTDGLCCTSSNENLDYGLIRQCCDLCISTAYNLIDTVYVNLGTMYSSSSWHSVYFTFSSAIVMLASLKSNVLNMQATDSSFQLHWTRCLAILDYYKEHVCSATQVIRSLQAVQQRMFKQQQKRADLYQSTNPPAGGVGLTPISQLSNADGPSFADVFYSPDGSIQDDFGTNLFNLNWLELFQSET
ncbi:hypothetical protein E4U60_006726 [Claviceps pazoutovae]|uniref:Zn(2)-C6 fungal-type domain-containing protein n=1 Tax=Claviceps pazoutovae TaxID=1649127 RepID=A0A9P7M6Q2_9HYPO|nr:hypothetical protein E4U60_006726 [Claviceps pazoutovae]